MSSNTKKSISSNPYSANLSDLFKDKSVKLISDPEGYSFAHLLNQRGDTPVLASESEPLIVLGDLLDSAIAVTPTGNILNMGNLAELKSHNLDNLLRCRDNPNIHLMFGNRDLNKLKVLPLTQVSLIKQIPNSNINLNDLTYLIDNNGNMYDYLTLASLLKQNINDKVWKWTIPDLKHWYPFWKKYNSDSAEYKLWQAGRHSESDTVMTCLERFFLIFGADNKDGTMSAHNLLYCIPYEVLNEKNKKRNDTNKNFKEFKTAFPIFSGMIGKTAMNLGDYKSVLNECISNSNLMNELELASALVLIVFMRLLMKKKKENNLKYDGLLYDLYTSPRTYFCAFAHNTKKLLAFSHGGITKNLLDTNYNKTYNMFFSTKKTKPNEQGNPTKTRKDTYDDLENYNIMTHSELQLNNLNGGFYKKLNINNSSINIHKAISFFNAKNKHLLKDTLDYYNDYNKPIIKHAPTPDLVKLLAMSSGFNTCMHDIYTECKRQSQPHIPIIDSAAYSPIVPGIVGLRSPDNTLYCNDCDFVQFIGHSPQGFGVTIDLFKSTSAEVKFKTYNINLDISNTTLAHDKVADLNKLKDNYLFMVYNNTGDGELYTHCKLHVANTDKFSKFPDKTITYDSEYNLFSNDFEESLHDIEPDNNNGFIHGKLKDSNVVFYSKVSNYDYTPVLEKKFGFDNKTTKEMAAYTELPIQDPFSHLQNKSKNVANAALYGGKLKTKRNISKKYKRAQTKKLKRK